MVVSKIAGMNMEAIPRSAGVGATNAPGPWGPWRNGGNQNKRRRAWTKTESAATKAIASRHLSG